MSWILPLPPHLPHHQTQVVANEMPLIYGDVTINISIVKMIRVEEAAAGVAFCYKDTGNHYMAVVNQTHTTLFKVRNRACRRTDTQRCTRTCNDPHHPL